MKDLKAATQPSKKNKILESLGLDPDQIDIDVNGSTRGTRGSRSGLNSTATPPAPATSAKSKAKAPVSGRRRSLKEDRSDPDKCRVIIKKMDRDRADRQLEQLKFDIPADKSDSITIDDSMVKWLKNSKNQDIVEVCQTLKIGKRKYDYKRNKKYEKEIILVRPKNVCPEHHGNEGLVRPKNVGPEHHGNEGLVTKPVFWTYGRYSRKNKSKDSRSPKIAKLKKMVNG